MEKIMKAKAAVFMGANKDFEIREFDVTDTPEGYGRLSLIASGVCGTDLHFHGGRLAITPPTIIGHEFVGRIDDADANECAQYGLKVGDNVIADIAVPCGECLLCKTGDDANCVNMRVTNGGSIDTPPYLYGGYTEINYTPLANLIKIPEELDPTVAAVFACPGPTVIHACRLAEKAGVDFSGVNEAVVQGLGPVGMFAVMYLKRKGVRNVYALARSNNKSRNELAAALGADYILSCEESGEKGATEILQSLNGGLGADLCIEASGAPQAVTQGFEILRNRGVYIIPGQYSSSGSIELQPQLITFKALHIIGSSQYSMCDVRKYTEFMCSVKDIHDVILRLVSKYKIEDINKAFADAEGRHNIKTLLVK